MITTHKYNELLAGCACALGLALARAAFSQKASAEANDNSYRAPAKPYSSPSSGTYRTAAYAPKDEYPTKTYTSDEIVAAGHQFFGKTTGGLAKVVQHSFGYEGAPTGYIVGEEASGAFFGGLRYGEGILHMKGQPKRKVYWQGPSLGLDVGGNGSRTMVLIYHMHRPEQLYQRYTGIEGSAYLVGGAGVNFQRSTDVVLAPIRTGVGARLGANIGYLKYTKAPTWNPF